MVSKLDDNCLEYKNIINPKTGETVDGYIFKDNTKCKLTLANLNATLKPIKVINYYYRDVDGHIVKITNMESNISSASDYEIIPMHTYKQLKNANRLEDRLFVLECSFEVKNGDILEEKKINIYFQLVSDEFFDKYKKIIENKGFDVSKKK
ncbi:MAG: hypothetical protein MJ151_00320 [Lachnospiraceae bacterium]|nr:hypothetical protein [Lachnospiraceae bacterium]